MAVCGAREVRLTVNWDFTGVGQNFLDFGWLAFLVTLSGKASSTWLFIFPQRIFFLGAKHVGRIFAHPVLGEDYLGKTSMAQTFPIKEEIALRACERMPRCEGTCFHP